MTTHERTANIIAEALPQRGNETALDTADRILRDMLAKRIIPTTMRASPELFVRFHAHTRYLGIATEYGYRYWYDKAVDMMLSESDWPVKIATKTIKIDATDITVDIEVAESTRKANNRQLLGAYQVIEDGAKEHGVPLPENPDE